ncbi:amino acid ABC transporter permease [Haloarchaeobius iranensis]|uniref:Amino acid ABC transporter membrane protein 1, PAAT family n=1 Tax=Haloarchaeobius iranensis TaxID=996166 RepID=A0A1G9Z1L6_9EURY|nr:amino acid ABC transporter permease [Haloarchaeobius iranensis]SDN15184.1 amino acid ABC transporter membrane protein 1, PAAT family [Haloarchaeobius iranensis]
MAVELTPVAAPLQGGLVDAASRFFLDNPDWGYVWSNRDAILDATVVTVQLTFVSIVLGFLIGLPAGVAEVYAPAWLRVPVETVGVVVRAVPILVILIYMFYVFSVSSSPFIAATFALGLRSGAYQSQIFRGAIQSVGEGQMEAARSVGMSKLEAIVYVIVPQSLRRSIPGFQNEFTIVLKDTSIAIILGVTELLGTAEDLFLQQNRTGTALELILAISLVYFVLTVTTNRGLEFAGDYFGVPTGENA